MDDLMSDIKQAQLMSDGCEHNAVFRGSPQAAAREATREAIGEKTTAQPTCLVHELFQEQVRRTPGALAVAHDAHSLTYAELNAKANQLARYLIDTHEMRPDRLVGICLPRSIEMVVAVLAVIKAGGAYVPLDPNYPPERLKYMLDDSALQLVLTQHDMRAKIPETQAAVVSLDQRLNDIRDWVADNVTPSEIGLSPVSLVYVIYTSGSTGRPKGTAMAHRAMVNLIEWHAQVFVGRESHRVLQFAALSFDVAFQEIFTTLCTGGTLRLLDEWIRRDMQALTNLLNDHGVQRVFVPPLVLQSLAAYCQNTNALPESVQDVITAGEPLRIGPEIRLLFKRLPECRLHNHYGPTETHVVTALTLVGEPDFWPVLPAIGRPIANTQIHILDEHRVAVPDGSVGELYISGRGLARGYLGKTELTEQRFISDPCSADPTQRLYKTGDLGRYLSDGTLEYLGRSDDQVKVRGFRIELGEIEVQLAGLPQVREAVVVAREDVPGDKRLVGYITLRHEPGPSIEALRAHLQRVLPEYMVPTAYITLKSFPLTPNGKLDRRALPAPDIEAYASQSYEAPEGETEGILAGIWQELLRMERVGRQDDFFVLGGHSLLIMQMVERLRKAGYAAEGHRVFESPSLWEFAATLTRQVHEIAVTPVNLIPPGCEAITPDMLPLVNLEHDDLRQIAATVPGGMANIQDLYPLAPLQEGILFHHLLSLKGAGDAYVLSMLLSVSSPPRLEEFTRALQAVINRHDILRTAVLWDNLPHPVQVVHRHAVLPVETLVPQEGMDALEDLRSRMKPGRVRLELNRAPLLRLQVATGLRHDQRYVLLQLHHMVGDHESVEIAMAEVKAYLEGHAEILPDPVPYRNHVWQARTQGKQSDEERFFRDKLGDVEEPTAPFGLTDVRGDGSRVTQREQRIESELGARLRAQARRLGVSAATLFHTGWALVLARTAGRDDVVFGTSLLGRWQGDANAQAAIGMFINTLPLRVKMRGVSVSQLIEQVQSELAELLGHEGASLAVAQRCSGITGTAPLFSALLNYRHRTTNLESGGTLASGIDVLSSVGWTNYPIVLSVDDLGEGFTLTTQTDERLDPQRMMDYVLTTLRSMVEALERAPTSPALSLSVIPESERNDLIASFNATHAAYPDRLIHELFEEQVWRTPNAVAVVHAGRSLTYQELNSRANQLAHCLREWGVGRDQLVGICVDRCPDLVIALLGVLKSGGAYLPLDPNYPPERLQYMLENGAPRVLLTHERHRHVFDGAPVRLLMLDHNGPLIAEAPSTNLNARALGMRGDQLAYVIYTSGSTGRPKGVAIEHRNTSNLLCWARYANDPKQFERTLLSTSLNFDLSVYECFVPLTTGGSVWIVENALTLLTDPVEVTLVNTVPSALRALVNASGLPQSVRVVNLAGEALGRDLVEQLFTRSRVQRVCNLYGPSETTTYSTWISMVPEHGFTGSIGRPIANTQVYILDGQHDLVPIGVTGEIYIGGAGVARGYLNRPDLTAERFLRDPFSADPTARIYKTGDVGRWLADGTIEYLGRNDHQVKIRGFRIELGEVEGRLARCPDVKEAVVIAREDTPGDKRLVGYVTSRENTGILSPERLRTQLRAVLPEHMVPSAIMVLERLPLTPNGKLDRRSLPAPELSAYSTRAFEAPQGEVEEILAGVWQRLLGVERVGRQDTFFELGGHSLLIVQMMSRLHQLGLSTDVQRVFASPTLADLALALATDAGEEHEVLPNLIPPHCEVLSPQMLTLIELRPEQLEEIVRAVPGGATNIQDIYPLAPLQEGILFHHLLDTRSADTYLLSTVLRVSSRSRLDELILALQGLVDRHDVLRTAVLWEALPRPVQVVYRKAVLPVETVVLDPERDVELQVKQWPGPDRRRLNLKQAPLLRLQIAADPRNGQWYALLQVHHMTCDHETVDAIVAEVVSDLEGRVPVRVSLPPYRNHVSQSLAYSRRYDTEAYFRRKLADIEEAAAPFGLLDVHGDGTQIEEAQEAIAPELAARVRAQARRHSVSAATLFHAAWGLVVAETSARDDVVFGTVLLGRLQGRVGTQQGLGMFINTLPLRVRTQEVTAQVLVEHTQRELVELLCHEQASLAMARRCSGIVGAAPLFTSLLNYRHSAAVSASSWANAAGIQELFSQERTNYPVVLTVDDLGEGFTLTAQTDPRIDPKRMIGYVQSAIRSLVEELERGSSTLVRTMSILPESERREVLEQFNSTETPYPREKTIHELFEQQVERTPLACAVVYEGASLTYAELNAQANQLAHYLIEKGVGADGRVGICVERSLEMVVGLLAILKAGGAYVPLDPSYPPERLQYMLEDASPRLALTQAHLTQRLPRTNATVVALDKHRDEIARYSSENPDRRAVGLAPHHIAYVIYTSGSTGKPKGVMVKHQGVVNFLTSMREAPGITPAESLLAITTISFDIAALEIYLPLITGARVIVAPREATSDASRLIRMIEEHGVTVLQATPATWKLLLGAGWKGERTLKALCGGETLTTDLAGKLLTRVATLWNLYGPTETTIWSTRQEVRAECGERGPVESIGRPIGNTQVYILNHHRQPVPLGVAGEIHIGGAGIAREYLNRPELTTDRFIKNPFSTDGDARLYRTGDVGRWCTDGTVDYLGRNDHQVKIRGFRIELGEIEARLLKHPQIKEAVVLAREDKIGDKRLVGYVIPAETSDADSTLSVEELRAHLKSALPEYMVPGAFVMLQSLPLTSNGKLDRNALPAPERGAYGNRGYEAPQGEFEEILAGLWQSLLKVERVGRNDNFFELGGHSLLIVQMLEGLRRVGIHVEVRWVFDRPTLTELAVVLSRGSFEESPVPPPLIPPGCESITPNMLPLIELEVAHIERIAQQVPGGAANIQDIYPLTPLQEGILFHHLLDQERDAYGRPLLFWFSSRKSLDSFVCALQTVIDRHDILRTAVLWEQLPRAAQVVYRRATLPVEEITLDPSENALEMLRRDMKSTRNQLELHEAPLIRLRFAADAKSGEYYGLVNTHHLVCDNQSIEILLSEVMGQLEGNVHALAAPAAYRNHVAHALAFTGQRDAESFFRAKLKDVEEPTAPFGLLDVHGDGSDLEAHELFEAVLSQRLRTQARRLGVSAATLFHAVWALVVAHTAVREDVVFGTVLLGRLQGSAGAQRILGMFINTLPLRVTLRDMTAQKLVEHIQRGLVELLDHEQSSLAVAQRSSGVGGSTPLFSTLLNYRHKTLIPETQGSTELGVRLLDSEGGTNYPITLSVDDLGERFAVTAQTDRRIDAQRLVHYVSTATHSLVDALEQSPETPALSLSILPENERHHVLEVFNATHVPYPQEKTLHELFEEQVRRAPTAVAVLYGEERLSYAELNAQANRLARFLESEGAQPGELIPVLMSRTPQLLMAQLAVLKCGGAYVPIDPETPPERQAFMLMDCHAQRVLADRPQPPEHGSVRWIDCLASSETIAAMPHDDSPSRVGGPDETCYAMYTSGSTGLPKGVIVPHRAVSRLVINSGYAPITSTDCVAHCSNPAFDASTFEIWGALLNGARVAVIPQPVVLDVLDFARALTQHKVSVLWLTVGLFSRYVEDLTDVFGRLRFLLVGGDVVDPGIARRALLRGGPSHLLNCYGPTEGTTFTTTFDVASLTEEATNIPIGRPIANTRVYILNSAFQPSPIGVTGELYVGGAGVASGYLNRPDLTRERFIHDPFSTVPGARLYKTGDLGRWRADGNIEFLGRNDSQVKIRGFRVELGEIEAQLLRHPQIRDAALVAREDEPGDKRLVGYVVTRDSASTAGVVENLRAHLKAVLPAYMVPSAFVVLEMLPLNASGKLNRRALPAPERGAYGSGGYEVPEGPVEEILAEVWERLLKVERVGRHENFFELGGHSLLGMKLIATLHERLRVRLSAAAVFRYPTVQQMAQAVEALQRAQRRVVVSAPDAELIQGRL